MDTPIAIPVRTKQLAIQQYVHRSDKEFNCSRVWSKHLQQRAQNMLTI